MYKFYGVLIGMSKHLQNKFATQNNTEIIKTTDFLKEFPISNKEQSTLRDYQQWKRKFDELIREDESNQPAAAVSADKRQRGRKPKTLMTESDDKKKPHERITEASVAKRNKNQKKDSKTNATDHNHNTRTNSKNASRINSPPPTEQK